MGTQAPPFIDPREDQRTGMLAPLLASLWGGPKYVSSTTHRSKIGRVLSTNCTAQTNFIILLLLLPQTTSPVVSMDVFILLTILLAAAVYYVFSFYAAATNLPPGPRGLPVLGNLLWLRKSLFDIAPLLRRLRPVYGPIITLRFGARVSIFVSDRALAHRLLVVAGAAAATRPAGSPAARVINSDQHSITSAGHGPLWRLLRRNLTTEILHPARVRSYAKARAWVLDVLLARLAADSAAAGRVRVVESFQYAMFCLLLFMCFGERLEEKQVREVETSLRALLLSFVRFNVFAVFPKSANYLFRKRWNELLAMLRRREEALIPLIRARSEKQRRGAEDEEEQSFVFSYVDSLLQLELPEEGGRRLTEGEIVTLCSEFINAGTDTTSTALQWVMANLVKHPEIQRKLAEEIGSVMEGKGGGGDYVGEEDLPKMKYLKAVVMETLRRHPPGHFVLPHAVKEELEIDGYVIPKDATVNFMVAEMGRDGEVWEAPMEFRPERFLEEEVDITGTKEIKMMPFGAGRRICPGIGLSMLHLEWFVANLVREFEWKTKDGEEVDLEEKPQFTVVMKKPLEAVIVPRKQKGT